MSTTVLFALILNLIYGQSSTFEFHCPDVSQWNARGKHICTNKPKEFYNCLWDKSRSRYFEYCGQDEIDKEGFEYILTPNPEPKPCAEEFYQPFTFTSIGNSRCIFSKSTCSGVGQMIADNRTSSTDRSCRCDYTRGYVYVGTPSNGCTCVPSEEDCSCYYMTCAKSNQKLYQVTDIADIRTSPTERSCRCDYTRGYVYVGTPRNGCTCVPSKEDYSCYYMTCAKNYKCYIEEYILPEKIACGKIIFKGPSSDEEEKIVSPQIMTKGYIIKRTPVVLLKSLIIVCMVLIVAFGSYCINGGLGGLDFEKLKKKPTKNGIEDALMETVANAGKNKKVVVVGDGACGKTCLLTVFHKNEFPTVYLPTVFQTVVKDVDLNGQQVSLALWDTAGQEGFEKLRSLIYKDCDVFLLCFSISNRDSFENILHKWSKDIKREYPNVPYVLVGNKKDLRDDAVSKDSLQENGFRFVTTREGKNMANNIKAIVYLECSAKNNEGVKDVFITASRAALQYDKK